MIGPTELEVLRCPACGSRMDSAGGAPALRCLSTSCGARWPELHGLPWLYRPGQVRGSDRWMRLLYDNFARLHDPAVRYLLPLMQTDSEATLRDGYMRRLDLASLRPHDDDTPTRILEVGFGGGANLPLVLRDLPPGVDVELWAVDYSPGMLRLGREAVRRLGATSRVRLAYADAHTLPFADDAFDRVFHVGATGSFRDPAKALAEMARVARPHSPIVVVDEQLDPCRRNTLYHRLMFRALTFYDHNPHSPAELLPPQAHSIIEEQVSRFYYCLTFRK